MRTKKSRLIVFSGMDGVGKSRHSRALVDELTRRGRRAVYQRLRFPFVTSVPLLLYARLRRWAYEVRAEGHWVRAHAFASSPFVRFLYPLTLFLDLLLATWVLVRLPMAFGRTVVCDRFVLDSLIDVASSCEREITPGSPLDRLYSGLVPSGTVSFLLTASAGTLRSRRSESTLDPSFDYRVRLYEEVAAREGARVVRSEAGFNGVHKQIVSHLAEESAEFETTNPLPPRSLRWYAFLRDGALPPALKKGLLLLTHWVFQSIGSMGRTERVLKAGLGLGAFAVAFPLLILPLGVGLGILVAGLVAHSANFLLDAHIPVVFKHWGRAVDRVRIRGYADNLSLRVRDQEYLEGAVVVGSIARNELGSSSDLDLRIIPKPGLLNALRAGVFVIRERLRALGRLFPLDIYLSENPVGLAALQSEEPQLLCDNRGALRTAFPPLLRT